MREEMNQILEFLEKVYIWVWEFYNPEDNQTTKTTKE